MNNRGPEPESAGNPWINTFIVLAILGGAVVLSIRPSSSKKNAEPAAGAASPDNRLPELREGLGDPELLDLIRKARDKYGLPDYILEAILKSTKEGKENGLIDLRVGKLGVVPTIMDGETAWNGEVYRTNDCAPGQDPTINYSDSCRPGTLDDVRVQVDYGAWLLAEYMRQGGDNLEQGVWYYAGGNQEVFDSIMSNYDWLKRQSEEGSRIDVNDLVIWTGPNRKRIDL